MINLIELLFSFGLFINTILFIPQFFKALKAKSTQGLSLLTFIGLNFVQLVTIFHAYIMRDYLLMIGYITSLLTCGAVTYLIIKYRKKDVSI